MLLDKRAGDNVKKLRSVMFYGEAGSGKTALAQYMNDIFTSHWKQATRGQFDEKLNPEAANV